MYVHSYTCLYIYIYIYKQLGAQNCCLHKYISRGGKANHVKIVFKREMK